MKSIIDYTNKIKAYAAAAKSIAPVENGTAAAGSYGIGENFMREGVLYKAKTAITAGDTLTLNTNYELDDPESVQIGNLKQALSNEVETRATLGAHNLAPVSLDYIHSEHPTSSTVTWNGNTIVKRGVSVTVNNDKSLTISGSNTDNAADVVRLCAMELEAGTYVLSGALANSSTDYGLMLQVTYLPPNPAIANTGDDGSVSFTLAEKSFVQIRVFIKANAAVPSGQTITFKPMVRMAEDSDTTYRPYVPTNSQLLSYKDNGVLGAKNLLPFNLSAIKSANTNGTWSGNVYTYRSVTATVADDGTVALSGTVTGGDFGLDYCKMASNPFNLDVGTYILSGCPSGGSQNTYTLYTYDGSTYTRDNGNGVSITSTNGSTNRSMVIVAKSGQNVTGIIFKPMIRLATDSDPTYQPYAMTNKELTDVAVQVEGKYVLTENEAQVNVTTDGVKTIAAICNELFAALNTYLANNTSKYIKILCLRYGGNSVVAYPNNLNAYIMRNSTIGTNTLFFTQQTGSTDALYSRHIEFNSSDSKYMEYKFTTSGLTITDKSSSVPASGNMYSVFFDVYKKIS